MEHLTTQEAVELGISISTMDILNHYITAEQDDERLRINLEEHICAAAKEVDGDRVETWLEFHPFDSQQGKCIAEAYWSFRREAAQYLCWRESELTLSVLANAAVRSMRFTS